MVQYDPVISIKIGAASMTTCRGHRSRNSTHGFLRRLCSWRIMVLFFAGLVFIVPGTAIGSLTYTIKQTSNSEAYARIKTAMDSAVYYYNTYTTITKNLTVEYASSVPTAQANFDGLISFGSDRNYQVVCTAMHEIAHAVGVGTTNEWNKLMNNGIVKSDRATKKLQEITGDKNAVLKGDKPPNLWHFWPYGLNYASEVKSEQDLINHCRIVNELYYEMFPDKEPQKTSAERLVSVLPHIRISLYDAAVITVPHPKNQTLTVAILTPDGRLINRLFMDNCLTNNDLSRSGRHKLPRGVYLYRVVYGDYRSTGTFTVLK